MISKNWLALRQPQWLQLETLLNRSEQSVYQLTATEIRELGFLYRGTINDLSRVKTSGEGYQYLESYLNQLVLRCHARVYDNPPTTAQDILHFFLVDFPRCFRKNSLYIFLAFLSFALGAVLGLLSLQHNPELAERFMPYHVIENLKQGKLWMDGENPAASQSSFLMQNNIRVAFQAYVGGIFFGVGTLAAMFYNGLFAFGGPLGVCYLYGVGHRLLNFVYAHGVIELTTIFIAGGAGMMIGSQLLFPGQRPRWKAVQQKSRESLVLVMGCVPLLIIAGIIEGMVSLDASVPTIIRQAIAVLSGLSLIVYLGFSGRKKPGGNA